MSDPASVSNRLSARQFRGSSAECGEKVESVDVGEHAVVGNERHTQPHRCCGDPAVGAPLRTSSAATIPVSSTTGPGLRGAGTVMPRREQRGTRLLRRRSTPRSPCPHNGGTAAPSRGPSPATLRASCPLCCVVHPGSTGSASDAPIVLVDDRHRQVLTPLDRPAGLGTAEMSGKRIRCSMVSVWRACSLPNQLSTGVGPWFVAGLRTIIQASRRERHGSR